MPPRFAYWTILLDGSPTSFRTKEREELLPTFNRLKARNPGAIMKWFSGGRLWDSPEQARETRELESVRLFRAERDKRERDRPPVDTRERPATTPEKPHAPSSRPPGRPPITSTGRRTKDWRPGGDHSDPRDKYKLPPGEARKRWKKNNLGPRPPARQK